VTEDLVPLAPRARWLFHLTALVRLIVFWTPAIVVGTVFLGPRISWTYAIATAAVVWILAFVRAIWEPALAFDAWGYRLRETDLLVRSGVLVRTLAAIPVGRVQFVDIHQGMLDQALGLATIRVHTASGLGADASIPGLDVADAETLRHELVARAKGDSGV
jgi:membrane protein YdbS with pleckstrin-like domain